MYKRQVLAQVLALVPVRVPVRVRVPDLVRVDPDLVRYSVPVRVPVPGVLGARVPERGGQE